MKPDTTHEMGSEHAWIYPTGLVVAFASIGLGIYFIRSTTGWLSGKVLYTGPWDYSAYDLPPTEYLAQGLWAGIALATGGITLLAVEIAQLYLRSRGHTRTGSPLVMSLLALFVVIMGLGLFWSFWWWFYMYFD